MSRYTVNKLMRQVNMLPDALAAYRADAAAFVQRFRVAQADDGHDGLTPDEARALAAKDYGALYGLGAHPYLLWSFIEAALVPPMARPDLVESFRRAAEPAGYPDWSTTRFPVGEQEQR
jgi:hypothetical protein